MSALTEPSDIDDGFEGPFADCGCEDCEDIADENFASWQAELEKTR